MLALRKQNQDDSNNQIEESKQEENPLSMLDSNSQMNSISNDDSSNSQISFEVKKPCIQSSVNMLFHNNEGLANR